MLCGQMLRAAVQFLRNSKMRLPANDLNEVPGTNHGIFVNS